MKSEKIYKDMIELLNKANDEVKLSSSEIETIATLINALVKSEPHIRSYFYAEISIVARRIKEILDEEAQDIRDKMNKSKNDKGGNILN